MSQRLTLELSDDEYRAIEKAAEPMGQGPAEWGATKLRRQLSAPRKGSPSAILRAISKPPHVTSSDVDALEESIAAGKMPIESKPDLTNRFGTWMAQPQR